MKKIIINIVLIFTLLCSGVYAQDFGFDVIVNTRYDMVGRFNEGYAAVKMGEKWGYVNENGDIIVPAKYDIAGQMNESKAVVGMRNTDGNYDVLYIDASGKETAFVFKEADGTIKTARVAEKDFENVMFYGGNVKLNVIGHGNVYFKTDGKSTDITALYYPTEGRSIYQNERAWDAPIVVQDAQANVFKYDGVPDQNGYKAYKMYPYNQGLAVVGRAKYEKNADTGLYNLTSEYGLGFVDYNGKFVIAPEYTSFYTLGEHSYRIFTDRGLASVEKSDKFGAINKSGETVIPFEYDTLFAFNEGLASFEKSGLWGVVDVYGKEIVPAKYRGISGFKNGIAVAYDGSKSFCIDRTGKVIAGSEQVDTDSYIEVIRTETGELVNAYTIDNIAVTEKDGRYGFGKISYTPPVPNRDTMDSWAYSAVLDSIKGEIVPAPLQNMYREKATRYDIASLLCNFIELNTGKSIEKVVEERTRKPWIDTVNAYPFYDAYDKEIIAANALGILKGTDGDMFLPYNDISRQDTAVTIMRAAQFLGANTQASNADITDAQSVSPYAAQGVNYVVEAGVMNGVGGSWNPLGNITRQEAYITFFRLFNNIK